MNDQGSTASPLRSRVLSGVRWTALAQSISQGLVFIVSIILARLLGPDAYGLLGMIMVFTGFAAVLNDLGLGVALVQRKELNADHISAAFWINALVGVVLTCLVCLAAPFIASFFKDPRITPLCMVISLRFTIDSLAVVPSSLLNRNMNFRRTGKIQVTSSVLGGLAGVTYAVAGGGVWALVAQSLASSACSTALVWTGQACRPSWRFNPKALRDLIGVSGYVFAFNVFNYWCRALDRLIIGRAVGSAAVGLYTRAYTLMMLPLSQVSSVLGRVMFPALASIQDDIPRMRRIYLKSISNIALITFPMMMGAFVLADRLIPVLLGEQWLGTIPIFKIFCWIGLHQSISTTVGWLYTSLGKTRQFFLMGVIASLAYLIAFSVGIQWGALGVAWAYLMGNVVLWYPFWTVPSRFIGSKFTEMVGALMPVAFCSMLMMITVFALDRFLGTKVPDWVGVSVGVVTGIFVYLMALWMFRIEAALELRKLLLERNWFGGRIMQGALTLMGKRI